LVHEEKKMIKCNVCNYSCFQKSDMNRHVASFMKKMPFKCDVWDYRCPQNSHMKTHVASVHEEKKHSNIVFVTTNFLKRVLCNHMLHLKEKSL
jgi:KRAB domain-containing zinc finger protein